MAKKYRADQVGSFLRPQEVKDATTAFNEGKISLEQLRAVQDEEIKKLLQMQKEVGMKIFSDGEWRRGDWTGNFAPALASGYVQGRPAIRLQFQGQGGNPPAQQTEAQQAAATAATAGSAANAGGGGPGGGRVFGAPLVLKDRIAGVDSKFLKANAPGDYKITMPAASYLVARAYNPEIANPVFGSRVGLLKAVAGILNQEIKALIADGCNYIQVDNPHYIDYVPEDRRAQYIALGIDPDVAIREDVEADNLCFEGIDRSNVTVAMHFCRGNSGGSNRERGGGWHTTGAYDRIAETVFGGLDVDNFLLEYDSERAGTVEPLKYMPKGKHAVLGFITTKFPDLENQDDVIRRIEEAAKFHDINDLSLSPQCGFASTFQGNPLTWDEQRAKLQLVVDTARKVWGDS